MKFLIFFMFLPVVLTSCKWNDKRLKREMEAEESKKRAYILGYGLGERIKQSSEELDQKSFLIGLRHSLKGKDPLLTREAFRKKGDKQKQKGGRC